MSASVYEGAMEETLQKMSSTGEKAGLVVFSDTAYELLPPGTPGRELLPILRYLKATGTGGQLPINPWQDFRAGTRISAGLATARQALEREHVPQRLDRPDQRPRDPAGRGRATRRRDRRPQAGGDQRAHRPAQPDAGEAGEDRGAHRPLRAAARAGHGRRGPGAGGASLRAALPWVFAFVALVVAILLAVNERALARLEVRA